MERKTNIILLEGEEFKDVVGYEGLYSVSNMGRMMSHKGQSKLMSIKRQKSHIRVSLCREGVKKSTSVHILVAQAFITSEYDKDEFVIDHINNVPYDNRLVNLQIITKRLNSSKDRKPISGYTGVYFDGNKWKALISVKEKLIHLGKFEDIKQAAMAYVIALVQWNNFNYINKTKGKKFIP